MVALAVRVGERVADDRDQVARVGALDLVLEVRHRRVAVVGRLEHRRALRLVDRDLAARLLAIEPRQDRDAVVGLGVVDRRLDVAEAALLVLPEAQEPLAPLLLALEDLLDEPLRVRLADDQRLLVVPAVAGHRALVRIGEERLALGVGEGRAGEERKRAQNSRQRPYPPHPTGNVHHSSSTRVTCRAAPARPDPAGSPAPARERFRRAARPAPALQVRAGDHPARAEHDLDRRRQDPAPEGLRLDRRLPPQPAAPRRLGPARRRDPPPPRGVAASTGGRRSRPARRRRA